MSDPQYQYWTTIIAVAVAWQSTNILAIVSTKEYVCRNVCIYIYMYSSSCPQLLLLLLLLLTATATAVATATSTATATATATVTAGALAIIVQSWHMCIYKSRVSNVCIGAHKTCNATYHEPPRRAPETTQRPHAVLPQIHQNIENDQFRNFGIDLRTRKPEVHTYLPRRS